MVKQSKLFYIVESISPQVYTVLTPLSHQKIHSPADPRSAPPPSSILDQLGVDFPLDPPSPTTSRLSEDIGECRLPANLVSEHTSTKSAKCVSTD